MICTPGTMLFLLRARSRLGTLCRSCYYHHASRDSSMVRASAKLETCIGWKKTELLIPARYFAAPVLPKPKPVKETKGPLLNNEITAKVVRLVTDDGHAVVSTREALDRARKLKLDLVEVQSKANPPVCKIMDFHKEKYKQQLKDKERAKKKSGGSMRKGVVKEVRFSIKTETKDLHMKADMIRRLMERGYPVKCMAVGAEDQDLGELLSRIVPLIEDISVIEAPPRVGRGQAHMVVRHAKFGSPKKSGKKASNVVEPIRNVSQTAASLQPLVEEEEEDEEEEGAEDEEDEEEGAEEEEDEEGVEEEEEEEEVVEQEDEKEEEVEERVVSIRSRLETKNANLIGQRVHNVKETMEKPPADSVWSTFNTADNSAEIFDFEEFGTGIGEGFSSDVNSSRISNESTTPSGVPSPKVDSRAKTWAGKDGEELTNRIFNPGWIPSQSEQSIADKIQSAGKNEYPSNHRLPPKNAIPQPPANQNRKSGFNANQEQSPPTSPGPTLSSYGIFSAKKTANSIDQKNSTENSRSSSNLIQNSKLKGGLTPNSLEFKGDGRTDKDIQGGWGQFSKPTSNPNQHRSSPGGHANTRR